jgi:adenosylhomocysteine nucleosidase
MRTSGRTGGRPTVLLWAVSSALLLASGCSAPLQYSNGAPVEAPSYLVVMSAYSPELPRLLEAATVGDTCYVSGRACYVGRLAGSDVILLLSGIGLENAAETARALLDTFDVSGIVFSGIAGGINPGLSIGDVTVPARWGHADGDTRPGDDGFWHPVDGSMLKVAQGVAGGVMLNSCTTDSVCLDQASRVITGGNGVSNSFFVDDPVYREWLWDTFQANAVDMETSAVAEVAGGRGVPFIAFRSLADLAGGGPGANEIDTFFQLAADNAAAVVLAFLEAWAAR